MAKLSDLKKYLNYQFSSGGVTGSDYKSFQTKYLNYLRSICNEEGWELKKTSKMHYEFSCFIKNRDKYVYLSIPDVRYWNNQWYDNILIRTAKDEKDYHGGVNRRGCLETIADDIRRLF